MTQDDIWFDPSLCFIDGAWMDPDGGETLDLENPSTGAAICQIARGRDADIDRAVSAARTALDGPWSRMTAPERGRILAKIGTLVLEHVDTLARLEAMDVGKPLKQARADAVALARYMEFYGGAADKLHGTTIPYLDGYTVYTLREPHGVTGHIIPWNYPMQIIGRSVGAALAMGNAAVLKPAEEACCRSWSMLGCRMRGRPARPRRASWCSAACSIRFWTAWRRATASCRWGLRWRIWTSGH